MAMTITAKWNVVETTNARVERIAKEIRSAAICEGVCCAAGRFEEQLCATVWELVVIPKPIVCM